jgi:pyruvate/2-oxoglutarate/acetoin dehydrogenase E1 component
MKNMKIVDALRETLRDEMIRDKDVFLIGEAIGGGQEGVYKVTAGLQKEFGESRVLDAPISESAIVGAGIGAALFGKRPVVEIMFGSLMALCADEFHNQAALFHYLSGDKAKVPMVIRTVNWMRMISGPHHCGLLDAWYMNTPGLKVVAPSTPSDAAGLLRASIRDDDPVIFIEHNSIYQISGDVPEGEHIVPIGKADIKREGRHVSVITYSMAVQDSLKAARQLETEGIDVEVVDLRTINPLDEETILKSVKKTGRAVIVYEGYKTAGVGAEISAMIAENAIDYLSAPIIRVANPDIPTPSNAALMEYTEINDRRIIEGIRKVLK